MYEGAMFFVYGLYALAIGIVETCVILLFLKARKFEFKSEKTLPRLSKAITYIPFYVNVAAVTSYAFAVISEDLALIFLLFAILLSVICATVLIFVEFIGIFINVQFMKRCDKKKGVDRITISIVSFIASAVFLGIYYCNLFPIFKDYFGIR